jgi:hypothetical protein
VCFGKPLRLMTRDGIAGEQSAVVSELQCMTISSRVSRKQGVFCCPRSKITARGEDLWVAQIVDAAWRLEAEGQQIPQRTAFILKHKLTGRCLTNALVPYPNNYGCEHELDARECKEAAPQQNMQWSFSAAPRS